MRKAYPWVIIVICAIVVAGVTIGLLHAGPTGAPRQPSSGPGGSAYVCSAVTKSAYGQGAAQYWLYEPARPKPASAPVIVFNHGWGATNPKVYGAWIEHLVRRGNIVIYPLYQDSLRTPATDFTPNAIAAAKDALAVLQSGDHVRPRLDEFAIVGHSAGGLITANMAALAATSGLPVPRAVMCVEPASSLSPESMPRVLVENLSNIPSTTLLLTICGQDDSIARDIDARKILAETPQIPPGGKDLITLVTDRHGSAMLSADHSAPCAIDNRYDTGTDALSGATKHPLLRAIVERRLRQKSPGGKGIDAMDYYGFWKLFDGLTDAAFYGKNREYALGDTPEQRYMGRWSDGTPVKEIIVDNGPYAEPAAASATPVVGRLRNRLRLRQ